MTDNELRVKIAEACGWRHFGCTGCNATPCRCTEWIHEDRGPCSLPDYLNDLNAMHEAEKELTPEQQYEYGEHLAALCIGKEFHERDDDGDGFIPNGFGWFLAIHATARQRALAFVQTIAAPPQVAEGAQEGK